MRSSRSALLIGNFLSSSGGSRGVCEELRERLPSLGWTLYCASSRRAGIARMADMVHASWRWRDRYSVAHIDVYSGLAFMWAEAVCAVLRRLQKPYVLTLRGGNLPRYGRRWPGRVRRLLRSAATVTAPSRYLLEQMGDACPSAVLLPNPLNVTDYAFRLREKPVPRLIWVRALHKIYNPTMAVRVVHRLRESFPSIRLDIVGPDKGDGSREELERTIADLGLQENVRLVGGKYKRDIPGCLQEADIFLNTTNVDNTPVSVMEAMASGLCVVSTDAGGVPYLVDSGQDALLVSRNDDLAMAAAVRSVLTDPGVGQRLSRNARQKVEAFDWSIILPAWDALLASAAQSAGHSRSSAEALEGQVSV